MLRVDALHETLLNGCIELLKLTEQTLNPELHHDSSSLYNSDDLISDRAYNSHIVKERFYPKQTEKCGHVLTDVSLVSYKIVFFTGRNEFQVC